MRNRHVLHVMASEWKKTRKTPVQLVMMLLVPVLSVLFLSWGMDYILGISSHYKAAVFFADDKVELAEEVLAGEYPYFSFRNGDKEDAEDLIYEGKIDTALIVGEEEIRLIYDSSLLTSSAALKDSSDIAADLSMLLEGKEYYDGMQLFYPKEELIDMSTPMDKLQKHIDQLAGVVGMIVFLMMASNAMTISARSITGEKERQTFDTLVLCPAPLRKILLGKMLIMMAEIFLSGVMGVLAAIAGMAIWSRKNFATICEQAGQDGLWILVLILLLLAVTMAVTAIFTFIGSAFSQTKKASLFSSAGMVIVSVAAMLPTFLTTDLVKYIPMANWTPSILDICRHDIHFVPLLVALLISAALLCISMILSTGLWERTSE